MDLKRSIIATYHHGQKNTIGPSIRLVVAAKKMRFLQIKDDSFERKVMPPNKPIPEHQETTKPTLVVPLRAQSKGEVTKTQAWEEQKAEVLKLGMDLANHDYQRCIRKLAKPFPNLDISILDDMEVEAEVAEPEAVKTEAAGPEVVETEVIDDKALVGEGTEVVEAQDPIIE
ncbi:hypothetical protein F0562_010669 [Nyssa sinensis]|uniref:Uncharacterized protein n=1 Tax=Nyssa sinensis TaxID=561372 RepID=A0A5J5A2F5_9ASTE|nr:hypothetical protein F0562_010669 [Nyssa sinensis]